MNARADQLAEILGGPTLIHLRGEREPPLFIATLLHGNETTGWEAVRELLRDATLPRSLLLFIGNVAAARRSLRHLDGQPDYNRIWAGASGPEAAMAAAVLAEVRRRDPVAAVDIHNTTGENPVYACVHRLDDAVLSLAGRFSDLAVRVSIPESMLSMALAGLMPAITLECGKSGNPRVTRQVANALRRVMSHTPGDGVSRPGTLLRTVARVRVRDGVTFSFDGSAADLRFAAGLDRFNFTTMPAGTEIGALEPEVRDAVQVLDEAGRDFGHRFLRRRGDSLITALPWIPSLFSANARVVRQDCLCYVMEAI